MDPGFPELPLVMVIAMGVFGVVFLGVVAVIVTTAVRSRRVLRDAGLDPVAAPAQLAARLAQGPLGRPATTLETRLAELDDLRRRGLITPEEHASARRTALSDPR
ncbi:SHOCT domain-containing protein [Blastococcus saxobsidens]|uniref:SHOCT domain-containing protein n=1 Tax=Blastococcus saxobsidens TaxID=138336 RepID=A0A6L9W0V2_9ACTN|nr:SHOCT domain-containing protein [Blastococcus saxobsidens]NEK85737.1 SHOCT domain-containing protein [Blastococcus saxobsidens]